MNALFGWITRRLEERRNGRRLARLCEDAAEAMRQAHR